MTRRATGADDPALANTTWPLPDDPVQGSSTFNDDTLEWKLRYGWPSNIAMLQAAEVIASYRALICNGTTKTQLARLAALRRVYRKRRP